MLIKINTFRKIKFFLSWWAYSFPMAAITIATYFFYSETGLIFFKYFALFLTGFFVMIILLLSYKTIIVIKKKELCIEED